MKTKTRTLRVATCQHPVSAEVSSNLNYILSQIRTAKSKLAEIVHFSESNLSGYGGIDFFSYENLNYNEVLLAIERIKELARELEIGVVLGTHLFEGNDDLPKNALVYINKNGVAESSYKKRILYGEEGTNDHLYYSPGQSPIVFEINRIWCGLLICHEWL